MRPIVRSLTYFVGKAEDVGALRDKIEGALALLQGLERRLADSGLEVFTKRIALDKYRDGAADVLLEASRSGVLVSVGYVPGKAVERVDVVELAGGGLYVPILHMGDIAERSRAYAKVITKAAEGDPVAATRISVGFHGEDFRTPYFPDSSSAGSEGIGLSFLYPHLILERVRKGAELREAFEQVFNEINNIAGLVAELSGMEVKVDYSLSPWMEKSVAQLLAEMGAHPLAPGASYGIHVLNKLIEELSPPGPRTGFNEVMLPYAEDGLLLKLGEEGLLRARDFLIYASSCVAGVDMVVVPMDLEKLAGLISDVAALAEVKRRPLGFRAIPVSASPGDKVRLGKFGEPAVIPY